MEPPGVRGFDRVSAITEVAAEFFGIARQIGGLNGIS